MFIIGKILDINDFIYYIDVVRDIIIQLFLIEEYGCISQEVNDLNDVKEVNFFKYIFF